jgi:hypothetical protein
MPEHAPWRPADVARIFGRQVLIQPYTFGNPQDEEAGRMFEEPGSIVYQVAEETGTEYVTCGDDPQCDPSTNAMLFVASVNRSPLHVARASTG